MGCGDGAAGIYESVIYHKYWIEAVLRQKSLKKITALINSEEKEEWNGILGGETFLFTKNKFN